jgi:hypothetical protein
MKHTLDRLPELAVPDDYELRSLQPIDIDAWLALLNENAELGAWTHERAARYFGPHTPVALSDSFFVMRGATPVATAQLELHADDVYAPLAELGWVAARPAFRGQGLGYIVCLAVLHRAAARNFGSASMACTRQPRRNNSTVSVPLPQPRSTACRGSLDRGNRSSANSTGSRGLAFATAR